MEFKVLDESKNRLVFQLTGETHTFCNVLKDALRNVKGVLVATYKIDHPLIGVPEFLVETKDVDPRKALRAALEVVTKQAEEFKKEVSKL